MTSLWFLQRLHGDEIYPLKFGDTSVGRDCKSNIETASVYASRKHCTINVSERNKIIVTDCGTSNGTYINTNKVVKETVQLFSNDQIGIGCSIDYEAEGDEKIYVFILKKTVINNLVVEISDDENEIEIKKEESDKESGEDKNDKENHLPKENEETSSAVPKTNYKQEIHSVPVIPIQEDFDSKNDEPMIDVENVSDIVIDSDCEEDDFAYSQRINQEIKSELMDMDEIFNDNENDSNDDSKYINSDDDDVILIDSDDDDEVSKKVADKWFAILSQNFEPSIKKEPIEYECEKENEIELENNNFPTSSCIVKLTDVLKPLEKKSRKLKENVRTLLESISSESSSEEEDEIPPAIEQIKKCDKLEETKKRLKSLCSSSSDENLSKKVKITEQKPKQTKIIRRPSLSSSSHNLSCHKKISTSSNEDQNKLKHLQSPSSDENITKSHQLDNDDGNNKTTLPKTNKSIERNKPKIIDPPHLPAKRGIHRGISIDTSEKMLKRAKITSRRPTLTFGEDEYAAKHEKEKLVELRKTKLRELAEAEAAKKQLKQDEVKVLNTPKVKLTKSNRGAFLTEDTIPKPSARIVIKNPTRSEVMMLPKIPRIKRKSECESTIELPVPEPEPVQEELFTIIVPKKSNLKKDSSTKNHKKSVRFDDKPQILFYQIDEGNILSDKVILKDAPTTNSMQPSRNNERTERKIKDPNRHRVQDVLTQVTEWPPEWFEEKFLQANGSPPVNGINHLLLPMIHEFKSFNDYEKILFPLMKLELWSSLRSDNSFNNIWIESNIVKIRREIRGPGTAQRSLYDCTFKSNSAFRMGSIVMVKFRNFTKSYCFLAYLSESKTIFDNNNHQIRQITLETSEKNFYDGLCIGKNFMFKLIGYIRAELNSFTAVYDLKHSPLCKLILDPIRNFKQTLPVEIPVNPYRSKYYDKLNEAQEQILMDVYKKCIDKKMPSISLVEGPAGTGKSILITNLILQLIFGDEVYQPDKCLKILLCAPSNAAVDIITYKLSIIRGNMTKSS